MDLIATQFRMPSGSSGYYRCNVLYCPYQNLPSTVILSVHMGKKLSLVITVVSLDRAFWHSFYSTTLPWHRIQLSKRLIIQPFYTSPHRIFPSSNPPLIFYIWSCNPAFFFASMSILLYPQHEKLQTGRHGLCIEPSALPADLWSACWQGRYGSAVVSAYPRGGRVAD